MGVNVDINDESPTVILPGLCANPFQTMINLCKLFAGESHCSDLSSISARDTPEMVASKERIFELIKEWLGSTQEDKNVN